MGRKSTYTIDEKINAVLEYKSGKRVRKSVMIEVYIKQELIYIDGLGYKKFKK